MEIIANMQLKAEVFIQLLKISDKNKSYGDGIGIILDGRRVLYYYNRRSSWEIVSICEQNTIKSCELVLYEKEKIKVGDTLFITNRLDFSDTHCLKQYCKVVGKESLVGPNENGGISLYDLSDWSYCYKVNQKY